MTVRVRGEKVPESVVSRYVSELVKAHPYKHIASVELIVEGDSLKVRILHDLDKSA